MTEPAEAQAARSLVDARLGRPVQDVLEAAVVLEAWGGFGADDALRAAHSVLEVPSTVEHPPLKPYALVRPDYLVALGEIGFVIGVLFTGFWVSSLADQLGERVVDRGWRLALPVSLGLQWLLKRRYVAGADGLGRLRAQARPLTAGACVLLGLLALVPGGGLLAAELVVVWTGGFVIARRGWGVLYALGLILGAVALQMLDAVALVPVAAVAVALACAYALWSVPSALRRPGPWVRALPAGCIGAGLGLLLVFEPRFAWIARERYLPALTILPSLIGSVWGGFHMTRLWEVMPQVLVSTSVRNRGDGAIGRLASRLLAESIARLVAAVAVVSAFVLLWVGTADTLVADRDTVAALLVAHGVLALAALAIALLEAFDRWGWALVATALGCAVAVGADVAIDRSSTPGTRIFLGAVVALVAAAAPLLSLLREPDRNLAAAL